MNSAMVPYVCSCGSPQVVAIPCVGQPFPAEGHFVNSSIKTFQETYGPGARFVLLRWRCIECTASWFSYLVHHTGKLDQYPPGQLFEFALAEVTTPSNHGQSLQPHHSRASSLSHTTVPADTTNVPIQFPSGEAAAQTDSTSANYNMMDWPYDGSQGPAASGWHLAHSPVLADNSLSFQRATTPLDSSQQQFQHSPEPIAPTEGHNPRTINLRSSGGDQGGGHHTRPGDLQIELQHNRGAHFDLSGYRMARKYGTCHIHKRLKKKCSCNYPRGRYG